MKFTCTCGHTFEYTETDIKSHRLMVGDATKREDVEKLMDGKKADMVFTDPPYGMDLDVGLSNNVTWGKDGWSGKSKRYEKVVGDDKEWIFDKANHFDCKEQFWWGADYYRRTLPRGGGWFVWNKTRNNDKQDQIKSNGSQFELCWSKTPHKREVLNILWKGLMGTESQDIRLRVHPTQKPIQVCGWFISRFSEEGSIVIDLFGGSGSTLIACEQLDRICYMMEISPVYCDVIRKRYEQFTKK
jgi:DNA modification methylase